MPSIFEQIRQSCAEVAELADHVQIDQPAIDAYADELPVDRIETPERDEQLHYFGHGAETVAYVLTLDTVNFGSGYFPWTQPRDGQTDYAMVARALTDRFESHGPFDPEQLTELDMEACGEIFAQETQHDARRKLMASYAHTLGELGEFLLEEYDGSYTAPVEEADGSAAGLVEILRQIPSFGDEVVYKNVDVPLYKRAQITANDLHLAFEGESWGQFDDIDELTLFADNRVPHVLRMDGLVSYSDELAELVDNRQLLDPGSAEEIEIRACAVHAVEVLSEKVGLPARLLDNYLWHRGQQDRYRVRPAHLTQSVYY